MVSRTPWTEFSIAIVISLVAAASAAGADLPDSTLPSIDTALPPVAQSPGTVPSPNCNMGDCFEARFEAFGHSEGDDHEVTASISGSFLTPRLPVGLPGYWANFLPRLRIGGILDLQGGTSYAYGDIAMTLPIVAGFFFEPFFGGAVHNGSLAPTPTLNGLGCPLLFHLGGAVGYAIAPHWNLIATIDHVSNGNEIGVNCGTNPRGEGRNEGINNYGAGIGYAF